MNNTSIILTPHVINTVKALAEADRKAIGFALVEELVFGRNPEGSLSPVQAVIYTLISDYVKRDSIRGSKIVQDALN